MAGLDDGAAEGLITDHYYTGLGDVCAAGIGGGEVCCEPREKHLIQQGYTREQHAKQREQATKIALAEMRVMPVNELLDCLDLLDRLVDPLLEVGVCKARVTAWKGMMRGLAETYQREGP